MEGNIVVLRRNLGAVMVEDRKRLEVVSEARLGEVVNKIVPIQGPATAAANAKDRSFSTTNAANVAAGPAVAPKAFMATVEGGVYLFCNILPAYTDFLMRLQTAVAERQPGLGYLPWRRWRAFRTEVREAEEPYRFVDGECLEAVLEWDDKVMEDVVGEVNAGKEEGEKWTVEGVRAVVEGLRRLR